MSVKKWLNHITKLHIVEALIVLSILISVASAIEHIDELISNPGPDGYRYYDGVATSHATLSNNTSMEEEIQQILSKYVLVNNSTMDCSNISEIIWYILRLRGYNATIVSNCGISTITKDVFMHMFVWVKAEDGVIVVEPIARNESIGHVMSNLDIERDKFFLMGWEHNTPQEYLSRVSFTNEMIGISIDYPIELLPIRMRDDRD
ncbi:MAG: hypothetical protein XD72_2189 [Methanothrix harundinacea]|uniref:Uncharacterized protein n=1 Tax=Methanothrix harundinacea TaxID=301375 RepID=A0A101FS98_9EURY|nr:MAG: hypothetical protein XD72_2189 [Methanothrix harundinacea]